MIVARAYYQDGQFGTSKAFDCLIADELELHDIIDQHCFSYTLVFSLIECNDCISDTNNYK